jgi:hypothetical protein
MTWNKIISTLVAVSYLVVAFLASGGKGVFGVVLFLILPMFCIWFSDAMGGYTGFFPIGDSITQQSPGILVRILGWVLLLLPIMFGIIFYIET